MNVSVSGEDIEPVVMLSELDAMGLQVFTICDFIVVEVPEDDITDMVPDWSG